MRDFYPHVPGMFEKDGASMKPDALKWATSLQVKSFHETVSDGYKCIYYSR